MEFKGGRGTEGKEKKKKKKVDLTEEIIGDAKEKLTKKAIGDWGGQ